MRPTSDRAPGPRATSVELLLAMALTVLAFALVVSEPIRDEGYLATEEPVPLFTHKAARNVLRYGPLADGLVPMIAMGERPRAEHQLLPHHPPLLVLSVAGVFALFGEGPLQGRLFLVLCWALTAAAVLALGIRIGGRTVGWGAVLALVTSPGVLREGLVLEVSNGPIILFSTLALVAYARYREQPGGGRATILFVVTALAVLSDWQGLLVAGFLAVDRVAGDARLRDPVLLLPALALAILIAWNGWAQAASAGTRIVSAAGHGHEDTLGTLAARVNEGPAFLDAERIGAIEGALRATRHALLEHLGLGAALLAATGALACAAAVRRRRPAALRLVVLGVVIPWTYTLLFSRAAIIHGFWSIAMLPGLALLAGLGLRALGTLAARAGRPATVAAMLLAATLAGVAGVRTALTRWQADLPAIRAMEARVDGLARALDGLAGPSDTVGLASGDVRHDALSLRLDRPVATSLASMAMVRALEARSGSRLLVAITAAEAGRHAALADGLRDYPFLLRTVASEPLIVFDLRDPPRFEARLPAEQVALFHAMASRTEPPAVTIEAAAAGRPSVLRIAARQATVMLYAGALVEELAPLHEIEGRTTVPLDRLVPGTWYLAAAGIETDPRSNERTYTAPSEPIAVAVPTPPGYVMRALWTLAVTLALLTILVAACAHRLREDSAALPPWPLRS